MARLFSNMVLKGVAGPTCSFRSMVTFESFRRAALKYSTVNGDSEMHDDFKPTSKLADSGISVKDIVEKDVKENPVMIYMKGVPDAPRCGFSALAVRALQEYGVPISARNILEDEVLKNSVKAFSNWPTFPQVFIKGEFIGGSDIIMSMHKSGELKEKLKDVTAK